METYHKPLEYTLEKAYDPKPSADDLALVNTYASKPLAADEVRVFTARLANSATDRDGERFQPALLDRFAKTLPGKKLLVDHVKTGLGQGKFCSAWTETVDNVRWLIGKFYVPIRQRTRDLIEAIDDGIADSMSLGFRAKLVRTKSADGDGLIPEYQDVPGAEALEGSFVWCGSQYGAALTKAPRDDGSPLGTFEVKALGRRFTVPEHIEPLRATMKALEEENAEQREMLDKCGVSSLPEAVDASKRIADGLTYLEDLRTEVVTFATFSGDVRTTSDRERMHRRLKAFDDVQLLKDEREHYRKRIAKTNVLDSTASGDGKDAGPAKERPVLASAFSV